MAKGKRMRCLFEDNKDWLPVLWKYIKTVVDAYLGTWEASLS